MTDLTENIHELNDYLARFPANNRITQAAKEQFKKPYKRLNIQTLEGAKPMRYEWLWPNMLAKGELHTFAGVGDRSGEVREAMRSVGYGGSNWT